MVKELDHAHFKPFPSILAISVLLGAALAGCLVQDGAATGTGHLYVKDDLTENATAVYITFTQAEVLPAGSDHWNVVFEGSATFEMLSLSDDDAQALLATFELSPGEYLGLRMSIENVTVILNDGNETALVTFGNVVTVAHAFTVEPGGNFEILLDFDLESGVSLESGEYVPVIGYAETTYNDENGNATAVNRTDEPGQSNAVDARGLHGICNAWERNREGRAHGNVTNATAFTWLAEQAAAANETTEDFCAAQGRPGSFEHLMSILREHLPERAYQALASRPMGPPDERGRPAWTTGGPHGTGGNETAPGGPGGQGGGGGPGNQTQGPPGNGPHG